MTNPLEAMTTPAPVPSNEIERLAALRRYNILDTPPEAAFDRITSLAARLFEMPIVLVSLLDESRAWFKSCYGFDQGAVQRSASICSFAILSNQVLVVPDTRQDVRFACSQFMQSEPGVRFYAGAPLLTSDGFNIGTLCLIDSKPRAPLSDEQQATLADLAAMVVDELELRLAARKIAQIDAALLTVSQGVSAVTGEAFFLVLVQHLVKTLGMDYIYIGLFKEDNPQALRTIAACAQGQIIDNFEYLLQDTPCQEVIRQRKMCCYPSGVQALFPNSPLLLPLNVESYIAIPFFDSRGTALGLLGAMGQAPLENMQLAESLLTLFAQRIATELERQWAEESMRQQREQLQLFIQHVPAGVAMLDREMRYLYVSARWLTSYGIREAEVIGKSHYEIFPEISTRWKQIHQRCLAGAIEKCEEEAFPRADGSVDWIHWEIHPWRTNSDEIGGIVIFSEIITERKQAEMLLRGSEEQFRNMADNAPFMVWVTDPTGYCTYLSQSWYDFTGQTEATGLGLGWIDATHVEDREYAKNVFLAANACQKAFRLEYRLRRKDGEYRFCIDAASPWFGVDGQFKGYVGSVIDITERKRAETEAEEHRSLLKAVTDNASVALFIVDERQQCVFMNPAAEEMTGFTLAQVQGRALHDLIHHTRPDGSHYPLAECPIDRAFSQNNQEQGEEVFVRKDGSFYYVSYTASPIRDATGIRGTIIEVRDISQEKQAEEQFRLMANSIPQLAWMANPDGWIFWYNQRWYDYTGTTLEQMQGWGWQSVHDQSELPKVIAQWQQSINTGEPFDMEFPLRGADGVFRWFLTRTRSMKDAQGKVLLWFGTNTDVSEQRQLVQERAAALATERVAREEAEKANRVRDEFLAVLSHELRSPLNPILGWAKLLKSGKLNPQKTVQALDIIERNAQLQVGLIADLLDISSILQGKLSLNVSVVNLSEIIAAAIETVHLAAQAKAIEICSTIDSTMGQVMGDAVRLQQVVWNLLSNAVKFTSPGGRVEVRLTCIGTDVQITVNDTGKGIEPEFLPYIFEYFRQEDASITRKFGGLGLGLAIARQIVEMHGGTIAVDSAGMGQGATFTVLIPLAPRSHAMLPLKQPLEPTSDLSGMKILVVDDEADSRELISFVLEQENALVTAASSGIEALQVIERSIPDLLISDIGMPEMDGYMLMGQIRAIPQSKQILAIALTAYAGERDRQQAEAAGFQLHLAKPVEPIQLLEAISNLIKSNQ